MFKGYVGDDLYQRGSSTARAPDCESGYEGSNPSPLTTMVWVLMMEEPLGSMRSPPIVCGVTSDPIVADDWSGNIPLASTGTYAGCTYKRWTKKFELNAKPKT